MDTSSITSIYEFYKNTRAATTSDLTIFYDCSEQAIKLFKCLYFITNYIIIENKHFIILKYNTIVFQPPYNIYNYILNIALDNHIHDLTGFSKQYIGGTLIYYIIYKDSYAQVEILNTFTHAIMSVCIDGMYINTNTDTQTNVEHAVRPYLQEMHSNPHIFQYVKKIIDDRESDTLVNMFQTYTNI